MADAVEDGDGLGADGRPHPLSPLFRGERVRVRGGIWRCGVWLPLTPTLSPQAGRGRLAPIGASARREELVMHLLARHTQLEERIARLLDHRARSAQEEMRHL